MKKISERLHLSPAQTRESYKGLILPDKKENHKFLLKQPQPFLLGSSQRMLEVMTERNLLSYPVDVELLFGYVEDHPELHQ